MTSVNIIRAVLFFVLLIATILVTTRADESEHDSAHDATVEFQEGQHYFRISPAVLTNVEAGSVEVLELFWYGCPHCYEFEKYLKGWQQDRAVNGAFARMPAVLNRNWLAHAKTYYALEAMGEIERLHLIIFEAIHAQGRRLRDVESIARFLTQHDIDAEEFKKAYDSFYVEAKIKRSNQLVREYGASAVPTVIINGKYRTSASDAGSYERVLQLVDQLVQREANLIAKPADKE